jgi:hypothetical protein
MLTTTPTADDLIKHVILSLENAMKSQSPLTDDVLALDGFTGKMTRHFYNNICNQGRKIHYLEVGTWKGSSLISAIQGNEEHVVCTVVDNWSQFNGPRDQFITNCTKNLKEGYKINILDADSFSVDVSKIPPTDVYLYDGDHTHEAQFKGITHYVSCLKSPAIVIVDDWNWPSVREGTRDGLIAANIRVVYEKEIRHTYDNSHSPMTLAAQQFWNGLAVFVVEKHDIVPVTVIQKERKYSIL